MANFTERARLLRQRCVACGRPIVEAESVEAGMGPTCRKRYGWDKLPKEAKEHLNQILTELSFNPTIDKIVDAFGACQRSNATRIESMLVARFVDVTVTEGPKHYQVKFDYHEGMVIALKRFPGTFWQPKTKTWWIPKVGRHYLWVAICQNYPGRLVKAKSGITRIPDHVEPIGNPNHRIGRHGTRTLAQADS